MGGMPARSTTARAFCQMCSFDKLPRREKTKTARNPKVKGGVDYVRLGAEELATCARSNAGRVESFASTDQVVKRNLTRAIPNANRKPYAKLSSRITSLPCRRRIQPTQAIVRPASSGIMSKLIPCSLELRINECGKIIMLSQPVITPNPKYISTARVASKFLCAQAAPENL